ncbi:MAG: hypothetical protein ABIG08_02980 [bacterium]
MTWLLAAVLSYLFLAMAVLIDKYILAGPLSSPKVYAFYVGMFGGFALILIPFGFAVIPEASLILLALLAGFFRTFAIVFLFTAIKNSEASRVVPAIGGLIPLFTFGLAFILSKGKDMLSVSEASAFIFFILGTVLITLKKEKFITLQSLKISAAAALFFASSFVLSKFVYLQQSFVSGFIWIMLGAFLAALLLILSKEVRGEIFQKKEILKRKTAFTFLFNQTLGAAGFILQNWAIVLVPLSLLSFVFALEGVRYVFILIFAVFLSLKFPKILKEEISKGIILQKILAILLIGGGLALLAL